MCRNCITPCTIKRPIFKVGSANPALWQKRETAFLKRWSLSTKLNGETSQRTLVLIFLSLEPQISLNSVVSLHCIYTFSVLVASHFVSLLCFSLQLLHSFTVTQICFVYDKVLWIIMASKFVRYWTIVTLFFFVPLPTTVEVVHAVLYFGGWIGSFMLLCFPLFRLQRYNGCYT